MLSVYLTLSLRHLRRRWFYALTIVASIAAGVSLLVATRAINQTMNRAALAAATPMSGAADIILSNGETAIDQKLVQELHIPGVQVAQARIFESVWLPEHGNRTALLIGIDMLSESKNAATSPGELEFSDNVGLRFAAADFMSKKPVIVGKGLDAALGSSEILKVQSSGRPESTKLTRVGTVQALGPAASLGGNVLILKLAHAQHVLGLPVGKVHRIDVSLDPTADRETIRQEIERIVAGRADVRSPDEQNRAVQNVMAGMQTALLLCGIAALVVGLFLVYNALSVSVAERRHEIGILLAVGATRSQIRRLFAGEAALLGLLGSLLGIPLGIGCAYLALEPVRAVLQEIFFKVNASHVEVDGWLVLIALAAGVTTAVIAALVPAIQASRESPAGAVRRMPVTPTWRFRFVQIASSMAMMTIGAVLVTLRTYLPERVGMYAGLALVVVASLIATPLLTALVARSLRPIVRRFCGLEIRLAADNLIRSPGRTGIVIAALAAGVGLFMQTAGTIKSNRVAIRQWIDDSMSADLVITSGGPVSAGGQSKPMDPALAKEFEKIPGIDRALGVRLRKPIFNGTQVFLIVFDADDYYQADNKRNAKLHDLHVYKKLTETKNGVIMSDNFASMHGVRVGDVIPLNSPKGVVELTVIGQMADYSWNHGSLFIHRKDYDNYWDDPRVDVFDIYLDHEPEKWAAAASVSKARGHSDHETNAMLRKLMAERKRAVQIALQDQRWAKHDLHVMTREQMQDHVDGMIERLYGIAYGQQLVVLFVAALGVVTALLISVLQRRREMGLLRAIGGSRRHVLRCVLAEAVLMGLIGSAIGFLVGIPLEWFALHVVIVEESGYLFPLIVPWWEALVIAGAAVLVATLAGVGPALVAVRQRIPEAIAME